MHLWQAMRLSTAGWQVTINANPIGRSVEEALRLVQSLKYHRESGNVCQAGWQPGSEGFKPDPNDRSFFEGRYGGGTEKGQQTEQQEWGKGVALRSEAEVRHFIDSSPKASRCSRSHRSLGAKGRGSGDRPFVSWAREVDPPRLGGSCRRWSNSTPPGARPAASSAA